MSDIIIKFHAFHKNEQIVDERLTFAVVAARHDGKWIFCRHKDRDTYEIPGGHREAGESIDCAAERELTEETGAVRFSLSPICVYSVAAGGETSYGKLYFADVFELGSLPPGSEIVEIYHFDKMPDRLTYPHIQPMLYEKTQTWLNLQSAKDELWDVYDVERNPTVRRHRRGDPLPEGDYHLVVHVWLQNSSGEFLITKRAPNKGYPNMWETTGGSAVAGDDSLTAAIREVKEETGLDVRPENGTCLFSITREDSIVDIWLFRQDFDIRDVVLQEHETTDVKYTSMDEIRRMIRSGEIITRQYFEDLFEKAKDYETGKL